MSSTSKNIASTLQSVENEKRNTFAEIAACLGEPDTTTSPQGVWRIISDETTEEHVAVFGPDGQFMEADHALEPLGFGSWSALNDTSFVVEYQRPITGKRPGVAQIRIGGTMNTAASFSGEVRQTTFDLNGKPLGSTDAATIRAERLNPALLLAR